ncbi:hypothetical protein VTL71DRAFT_5051 [Oculimacula yallundae]|uniref:Uncharacterized protein n=1 Tax=Oculimacula yallundae TaxID=86028 RepID=A0ABR4C161_9HELO
MASAERKSKPGLGRKNTFQKMLDLEQTNKVNRMRASPANTPTPRSPPPPRSNLRQHPPMPMPSIDRAMTAPTLSVSIPAPKLAINGASQKYVVKPGGDLVLQDEDLSEPESAISSICQSPGWEDYNGKKRKKAKEDERERRRKEIERTSVQLQQARNIENLNMQAPHRLSKAPPTNKRLSKLAITSDRSVSAPAVPTLPVMARGDVKKEEKKPTPDKAKRSSLDIGLRGIISGTQAPWKSAQNTPIANTSSPEVPSSRKSFMRKTGTYNDGGFIGGLKLERFRQTETIPTQQIRHEHKKVGWSDGGGETSLNDGDPKPRGAGISSSNTSMAESLRPISIYDESVRAPREWDSIYSQNSSAAPGLDSPAKPVEGDTPMMERNPRRNRTSHPPTSKYFPSEHEESGSSQRDSSNGSRHSGLSRSRNTERKSDQRHTQPPVVSQPTTPDPQPIHDRGSEGELQPTSDRKSRKSDVPTSKATAPVKKSYPPESRGRAVYARFQRQEEENNAAKREESENSDAGARKPRSRRGSFSSLFSRSRSRTRASSEAPSVATLPTPGMAAPPAKKDAPITTSFSTIGSNTKSKKKDAQPPGPFLDEEYVLNQLHLELTTKAADSAAQGNKRASSKGPTFQGLKSAARSAFTRHSIAGPQSPTGSFTTAVEFQGSSKASSSKRASLDAPSPHISSFMKADIGAPASVVTPIAQEFTLPRVPTRSPARSPARKNTDLERDSRNSTPKALTGTKRSNHSRSATDSSEEYSTLDESSNITTPNASRPQSQKDYFTEGGENSESHISNSTSPLQSPQAHLMNGITLVDDAIASVSARNSWCRTGEEIEPTEDEDRLKTPTGNNSAFDFTTTHTNNSSPQVPQLPLTPPADASDLQRRPSLARSISTPELQDLSFLPPLKHQALTRPPKGKGKATTPKIASKETQKAAEEALKALVRPPPIPTPITKSEGSSPASPQPSQYLHNARLSLPGARSPSHSHSNTPTGSKTTFPPGPPHKNGTEPIAKMFVICCQCKYFHDMPSKIYECMAKPDNVITDSNLGVSGVISTSVKCPWCAHGMSTSCCEGYAAVVYLSERLH